MGKRLVPGTLVLVGLISSVGAARADIPQIVVPGKGHRYVVWLDPVVLDGTKPPLTPQDQLRYCSAAEGFARRIWKITNGRHRIFQVEFDYGTAPLRWDVHWRRYHATANATLGGGNFDMFDSTTLGIHTWIEQPDGTPGISVACPAGLTVHDTGSPNRETCVDANGVSPLESPQAYAATLAHEASHSHYRLFDEYLRDGDFNPAFPFLYGARVCLNPEWHTSFMASLHEDVWCDENTHLNRRFLASPFSGRFQIGFAVTPLDSWTLAKGFWSDLSGYNPGPRFTQGPGVVPQNEYFTNPVGEWAPLPNEPFCVFTGSEFPAAVLNDLMIVVDKSGSMGYRTTPLDQTAFQAAFSAGLGHYNRTPAQRKSGLSVFDSAVTRSIPYSLRGSQIRSASEFNLTAGGNTNLCSAISDAAAQVRAGGTNDAVGHMVLLTDGRPTVPGCDTGAAVRDAATKACLPSDGSKPVAISAVAFGDADFALIQQISDLCGGISRFVDDSGPDQCGSGPRVTAAAAPCPGPGPQPAPINIKVASARLAYRVRNYHEAMFVQEPKPLVFERSFDLPPGTAELEAVWMGELFEFIDEAGGSFCRFDRDYTFELVDPAGSPAGFDPVTPAVELQYLTRTRRVTQPEAGRWTMRVTGGAPCVTDNEFHSPSVAMFAMYRNHALKGHLAGQARIKANEPLRVTAVLETGPNTAAAGIVVAARLVNGPREIPLPMFDDGVNGGDEVAGDGKYSGLLNPSCSEAALLPGSYRLVVEYHSDAATAQSKLFPDSDVLLYADPLSVSPPASASLVEERTVVVEGCNARFPGCPGQEFRTNLCPETGVLVGGGVSIVPGTTVRDVSVDVQSCPIGTTGVAVGAGPGVQVSNVRSSYDDVLAKGRVTFDLTAAANAPRGEQPITVFWGRQRCDILGCTGDTTPPVITPVASVVDVCRPKPQPVQLPLPQNTDNCTARTPRLTGEVIAIGGRPLPAAIPIVNGQALLPLGTHTVRWRSEDSEGNVATLDQPLEVRFRESASCCTAGQVLTLGDGRANSINTPQGRRDCVLSFGGADTVSTNDRDDTIFGGDGGDHLEGGSGSDLIVGGEGADHIIKTTGRLEAYGMAGADAIQAGQATSSELWGGSGADQLVGGPGGDLIYPGAGAVFVSGEGGDDTVTLFDPCEASPGLMLNGGTGHDTLVTPVPVSVLQGLGVAVFNFENVVVDDSRRYLSACFSAGAPPATGCTGLDEWAVGVYTGGQRVRHHGQIYECQPFPFEGWCGQAGYEPGVAPAWPDAWRALGPC